MRDIADRCEVSSHFDDVGVPEDSRVRHSLLPSFLPSFSVASSGKREPGRHPDVKDASSSKLFTPRYPPKFEKIEIIRTDITVAQETSLDTRDGFYRRQDIVVIGYVVTRKRPLTDGRRFIPEESSTGNHHLSR